jgi:hypothetical protein
VVLSLHELEQELFPIVQELQASLGQVDVAARGLQEKDGDGEGRHTYSKYGPDADIHQRCGHPSYLPPNAARSKVEAPAQESIKSYKK